MTTSTEPEVFIIESLTFEDERRKRFEGRIISQILEMSDKRCEYYYVRTKREFRCVVEFFTKSRFRYLHISCHADARSMATTLETIPFDELASILEGRLKNRRLFVSACSMASPALANSLMTESGCYSILGPSEDVYINDAAILWSALYHVMFKVEPSAMKRAILREKAAMLSTVFGMRLNLFVKDASAVSGHRLFPLVPKAAD